LRKNCPQLENLNRSLDYGDSSCIGPLIQTLKKMKVTFGSSVVVAKTLTAGCGVPKLISVGYTAGEEFWIQNQFAMFQNEYVSVAPPPDYLLELYDLLLCGKMVSDGFIETWMIMEMERLRRVLKMHHEFQQLTDRDQVPILP
jgi:hypothetical protein